MKFFYKIFIIAIFAMFYISAATAEPNADLAQREAIKADWVEGLRYVINETHDPNAQKVLEMLETQMSFALPTERGVSVLAGEKKPIRLLVLLPEDIKYSEWKEHLNAGAAGAYFFPRLKTIVLKNGNDYGKTAKGVILFHEGMHALHYLEKPYESDTRNINFCREEQTTEAAESPILSALGGKEYDAFVAEKIEEMTQAQDRVWNKKIPFAPDEKNIFGLPLPEQSYRKLEHIFGGWKSDREGSMWVAAVWIDTMFLFIDNHTAGKQAEKDKAKTCGLCAFFQHVGLVPSDIKFGTMPPPIR